MSDQPYYARELMISKVVTLSSEMDVFDAIGILLKNKISGAPVVDAGGSYVGVFSERNCLSMLVNAAYEQLPTTDLSAFVTKDAPTIDESADILAISQVFLNENCRRLPVLKDGNLVGQVSRRDVLRVIHAQMKRADSPSTQLLYLSSLLSREDSPV